MAQDYSEYLAIHVLNEQQAVSYRSLSRALKVHSNRAKQMLYEFHRKQNGKRPGSVHATYLITGTKRRMVATQMNGSHSQADGDTVMQSSPPLPASSAPESQEPAEEATHIRTVMLVKEEHLEQAKAVFDSITGIHVYSLQANGLSDVQVLIECNRQIAASYASEDPLQAWKQYGTIQNPNVKRRTQRRQPAAPAPLVKPEVKAKSVGKTVEKKQDDKDSHESELVSKPASKESTPAPEKLTKSKPAVKRETSDIFKSFAKGKTKPQRQETASSAEATPPAAPADEPMNDFSDDDAADVEEEGEETPQVEEPTGPSKKEREAELTAMMDQEDEPMEDAAEAATEPENTIDKNEPEPVEQPSETVTVENGRRRGRRRVMRKKTVKDEDGYLVTKEEVAWESFSEEEPAAKKIKMPSATNANKPPPSKKVGKPGQGNIMSFFGKK